MTETPQLISTKDFAKAGGVTTGFASLVLRGKKPMPRRIAIRVYRETGLKLGPIVNVPDADIDVLERNEPGASA